MNIQELFDYANERHCSDLHITPGTALAIRRYGDLTILDGKNNYIPPIEEAEEMILSLLDEKQKKKVLDGEDVDFGAMLADGSRIRANIYHQRNHIAASIRLLEGEIPTVHQLGLPKVIQDLSELPKGLVLVTGPTGSGKSTTLASMLQHINKTERRHIITIEDPIEHIYRHDKAMIHQREVGTDVADFATALRSALREDPDIIMVGEMRDYETISAAITAAETGHLVLATLHTTSAAQTVERIIEGCPVDAQNQTRVQLANVLRGVITQILIKKENGQGRVCATEILINTTAIANSIRDDKLHQIPNTMQSNIQMGMHTLNYDLVRLVKEGQISKEAARKNSTNIAELESMF